MLNLIDEYRIHTFDVYRTTIPIDLSLLQLAINPYYNLKIYCVYIILHDQSINSILMHMNNLLLNSLHILPHVYFYDALLIPRDEPLLHRTTLRL